MSARVAEEVSVSLSSIVDGLHKDVFAAEGGLSSSQVVFKEEAEEQEGNPEDESGKRLGLGPGGFWVTAPKMFKCKKKKKGFIIATSCASEIRG